MRNIILKSTLSIFLGFILFFGVALLITIQKSPIAQENYGNLGTHSYDELPNITLPESNYISYSELRNNIALTSTQILAINPSTWGKIVRFDTAEELYRFSLDVSYDLKYTTFETKLTQPAITVLLSLDYVLGRDIDYTVMKSKQFNPIGYSFSIEGVNYNQSFKGTFDGNGFEISSLYFSGYDKLTQKLYEGTEYEVTVSYVEYYAMFAYNEGTIQNFGLINPTYEFNFESETLFKAANLIGKNMVGGNVNHVYVIDTRATALTSGIRMIASAGQASGVMFDNYGSFTDAYFVGKVVVNASYGSRFSVQPVLFSNYPGGTYNHIAFDDTVYQETVTIAGSTYNITLPNSYATSLTTTELRSTNLTLGTGWYYYPSENNPTPKYPSILGLERITGTYQVVLNSETNEFVTISNYFVIEDALDFIAFSKMLNYTREAGLTPFRELSYLVTGNIDMSVVSANAYATPTVEFSGTFAGANNNIYISHLQLVNGMVQENYYAGLFGILRGNVYNLIFLDASLSLTETDNYAGVSNNVGLIAGELIGGNIRNVLVDVDINLGTKTLGELYVGAIVGRASGFISGVYAKGLIDGSQNHIYRTDILINPTYYIGGIAGSTSQNTLILTDAFSEVDIYSIKTSSTSINASSNPTTYLGGVIGYVNNTLNQKHIVGLLSSTGILETNQIISSYTESIYVGGIIGMSTGLPYDMNIAFGNFNHYGQINVLNRGTNIVYAAGILNANHTATTEFIHLFNHEEAEFVQYFSGSGNFSNLYYTTLVYNHGESLTLSQSRNDQDLTIVGDTNISGVYHSTQNAYTLLRFVENYGDIIYENQTLATSSYFTGITLSENIDFQNVSYHGTIRVTNVIMQGNNTVEKQLFVSGITTTLTSGRKIVNGVVDGQMIVAGITGNQANYTAANNLFVGGFVNYNYSGNMDPNGTLSYPVASIGIINSINNSNLISTYGSYSGISGHTNAYVGGIATFNDGDIQNSANMGDIRFENTSNVDENNVLFNTSTTSGGSVYKYRYGIIAGGVTAAVLSYKSRIYDSSNNGTIIAKSKNFARAGGILGIAIYIEIIYGNVYSAYTSATTARIDDSILSNCINTGDISALTITISDYSDSANYYLLNSGEGNQMRHDITQDVLVPAYDNTYYSRMYDSRLRTSSNGDIRIYTKYSSDERPGISASSGGVIGYGLSVMRRMMNHGQVSSTDVAGGVVGATVVIGSSQYVKIDTAINYGTVRAFDRGTSASNYANFNQVDVMDYESIRDHFYAVDSTFIFPETYSDIRLYPENKRGIGGIFGRLQRGSGLIMYGNNDNNSTFNFIVNMDPNVDLIGRLDQVINYYSSLRFYDFTNAVYYSARKNDTTQAIFTGINFFYDTATSGYNSVTRTRYNVQITSQKYEYSYDSNSGQWLRTTYLKTENRTEVESYGRKYTRVGYASASVSYYQTEIISRSDGPTHGETGWVAQSGSTVPIGTLNEYKYEQDLPLYNQVWDIESSRVRGSNITSDGVPYGYYTFANTINVPTITEDEDDPQGEYVYDPSFEMQTDTVLQQYIYYSENGNLSDTFINSRPNGMYVLATSSGSTFGSILPANIKFNDVLPLADGENGELPSYDIDYDTYPKILATDEQNYLDLLTDYESLFQTKYSDKADLLDESEDTLYLSEYDGSMTKLLDPTIVKPPTQTSNGVITFNINLATLDFNGGNLATVNYHILGAQLPNQAIIAQTIEDYYNLAYGSDTSAYINSYRALLEDYADDSIPLAEKVDLEPVLSYTFDKNNIQTGIITIGYFTSYSEVSQYYSAFLNDLYVTDYQVRLNVSYSVSPTLPYLYSYQIDGGTVRTTIVSNITAEEIDTSLTFSFRDPGFILPIGTDILSLGSLDNDNVRLEYYDETTSSYVFVEYEDYDLTSVLLSTATNHPFSFTLYVNSSLKGGLYRVGFRLLPYQDNLDYYTFTKRDSSLRSIDEISHYSSGVVTPVSTTITSYVNFGYAFDFSDLTVSEVLNPAAKAYQAQTQYYSLPFMDQIVTSDFATISNVSVNSITYQANGFRIYNISYTVLAENGINSTIYNHQIIERNISIVDVYRNNNKVIMNALNPVIVTREALSTTISLDFDIDESYAPDIYNLIEDLYPSYFSISPAQVDGITYSVTDNYLVFTVDDTAIALDYEFDISYVRTGDSPIDLGTLYVRKNQGTDAYLIDIQFAELATETVYAPINVSDTNGVIITSPYSPSIYYAGIDYDGADVAMVENFRVDGQVSNIPLDEYIPYFLNYLPLGASIAKKLPDNSYTVGVTGPDDPNVYVLAADFTASEEQEGEDLIITYRVTSEDGLHFVYYHVTVTDITYNVSYIFDVVYEGNALLPSLEGRIVIINVRNMDTNLPVGDTIVTTLPAFSEVIAYTNTTNLFYMVNQPTYKFRFGRNKSGYFSFNVDVLDPDGLEFDYKIELNGTVELDSVNTYDTSSSDDGKYYYINSSTQNRSRSFVITIYNAHEPSRDYGFTDFEASWR